MPRANQETCPHPPTKWSTPSFGRTVCTRCGGDITPARRVFEHRAAERTIFKQGDRVHVKAYGSNAAYKGTFQWAETQRCGTHYVICEKQWYKLTEKGPWLEGTAAVRHVPPEHVRHDDGVRNRRRREEAAA